MNKNIFLIIGLMSSIVALNGATDSDPQAPYAALLNSQQLSIPPLPTNDSIMAGAQEDDRSLQSTHQGHSIIFPLTEIDTFLDNTGIEFDEEAFPMATADDLAKAPQAAPSTKKHICYCGKAFSRGDALTIHQRTTHTGEKPYQCDRCQQKFTHAAVLKRHQKTHAGEKPYKCDICQQGFTQSGHLKRHQRIHTGEKPHTCDICQKGFTQSCHLKAHQRTHTGEKPYKCDICQKNFTRTANLKTHQRSSICTKQKADQLAPLDSFETIPFEENLLEENKDE
jgi:hypothetical protein